MECKLQSVECGVWSAAPATQNDGRDFQNAAIATKTATDLAQTTQKYCACHTKRFSTRYQTGWNVTKWRACHAHAKTTLQPAWKPSKRKGFAASPIDTARPQENQRLETRPFRARRPQLFTLCSLKSGVSYQFS